MGHHPRPGHQHWGGSASPHLTVTLSGQVTTDDRTARGTLEQLPPGRSADVPFHVRAGQAGANVPVYLDLAYEYRSRRYVVASTQSIRVVRDHLTGPQVPPGSARLPIKVLILAANPPDTEALRIDRGDTVRFRKPSGPARTGTTSRSASTWP